MNRFVSLVASCALAAASLTASAEIYRWTDEQGVERFSDRIENVPERFRRDVTGELRGDREARPEAGAIAPAVPHEPPAAPVPDQPQAPPVQAPAPPWSARLVGMGVAAVLAAVLLGIGLWLVVTAVTLRIACRLIAGEAPGFGRAFAVGVIQLVVGIVIGAVLGGVALAGALNPAAPAFQGVQVLISLAVNTLVIRAMLALGLGRALAVALVQLLVTAAVAFAIGIAIVLLVTRFAPPVTG